MSDGSDIGFGIFLKTKVGERQRAGEMTEVLSNQRYKAIHIRNFSSSFCAEPSWFLDCGWQCLCLVITFVFFEKFVCSLER